MQISILVMALTFLEWTACYEPPAIHRWQL